MVEVESVSGIGLTRALTGSYKIETNWWKPSRCQVHHYWAEDNPGTTPDSSLVVLVDNWCYRLLPHNGWANVEPARDTSRSMCWSSNLPHIVLLHWSELDKSAFQSHLPCHLFPQRMR